MNQLGILGIHHVAVADRTDADVRSAFATLLDLHPDHHDAAGGFDEHSIPIGAACLHTLEASGEGVVQRFLDRRGPGLHHVAFAVADVAATLEELRRRGARLVDEVPRPGGAGTLVGFAHPSSFGGLLVEFVQQP